MDRLAAALGMDPVELRMRNAMATGDDRLVTGQVITGAGARCAEVIEAARRALPAAAERGARRSPCAAGRRRG